MTQKELQQSAKELGFQGCYLLKPIFYASFSERRRNGTLHADADHLIADPAAAYPWANTVIVLLYPYRPYPEELRISGYYVASNAAYHAAAELSRRWTEAGVQNARADLPVRETLLRAGIGIACKSGLTAVPPFGTRFAAQMLAAAIPDVVYAAGERPGSHCADCCRCTAACPSGAISEDGLNYAKCVRAYMGGEPMPDWVMEQLPSILGCEACQYVCPYNAAIGETEQAPEAFALLRLLAGDHAAALELIGKNMKKNGRLFQHAAVMAGREGRRELLPLIERLLADERPAVQSAARFAISLLRGGGK